MVAGIVYSGLGFRIAAAAPGRSFAPAAAPAGG